MACLSGQLKLRSSHGSVRWVLRTALMLFRFLGLSCLEGRGGAQQKRVSGISDHVDKKSAELDDLDEMLFAFAGHKFDEPFHVGGERVAALYGRGARSARIGESVVFHDAADKLGPLGKRTVDDVPRRVAAASDHDLMSAHKAPRICGRSSRRRCSSSQFLILRSSAFSSRRNNSTMRKRRRSSGPYVQPFPVTKTVMSLRTATVREAREGGPRSLARSLLR